jgi:hypothetical protein
MRRLYVSFLVAFGLFCLVAAPSAAITNGQPDGGAHPYVGIVFNNEIFCSGTLIAPTVFLTAAHCTSVFAETFGPDDPVVVSFDPDIFGAMNFVLASSVVSHPNFCLACAPGLPGFDTYDVGLVLLSEPITDLGFGALPQPGLLDQLPLKQETFTAVGYGVQEFAVGGGPPQPSALGSRYVANVQPIGIKNRVGNMFLKILENKGGTCFGDSGGPIFLDDQVTIVAITSFGNNQVCAGVGYHQRLDREDILSFIDGYL